MPQLKVSGNLSKLASCVLAILVGITLCKSTPSRSITPSTALQNTISDCQGGSGGRLFSSGGFAQVTRLSGNADFNSDLKLSYQGTTIQIATEQQIGSAVKLPKIALGEELIFQVFVRDTGQTFRMGPGSRNADGRVHAVVQCLGEGKATVRFEDKFGGGDNDFDDVRFEIRTSNSEMIFDYGECGRTTQKGILNPVWGNIGRVGHQPLVSNAGEKLELHCEDANTPTFILFYSPPGGSRYRVGICPFEAGCNESFFSYTGLTNGRPDRFLRTLWRSKDYGKNDQPNHFTHQNDSPVDVLDHAISTLYVPPQNVTKADYKYEYGVPPPLHADTCLRGSRPEGALLGIQVVDPPLGPITEAFFNQVLQSLQTLPTTTVMSESVFSIADLNVDGIVDERDRQIFSSSLGSCVGAQNFNPSADLDGDACVTADDEELFLGLFNSAPENRAPTANCKNIEVVADSSCHAMITPRDINNSSSDPDGDQITLSLDTAGPFSLGQHLVTLTVTDSHGASSSCTSTVTVVDRTPPVISNTVVDRPQLWPPNHQMEDVRVGYSVSDNCAPSVECVLTVSSNEAINARGDGNSSPDWQVIDANRVRLRSERAGNGNGRIYTISITCTDSSANASISKVIVIAPKSQGRR